MTAVLSPIAPLLPPAERRVPGLGKIPPEFRDGPYQFHSSIRQLALDAICSLPDLAAAAERSPLLSRTRLPSRLVFLLATLPPSRALDICTFLEWAYGPWCEGVSEPSAGELDGEANAVCSDCPDRDTCIVGCATWEDARDGARGLLTDANEDAWPDLWDEWRLFPSSYPPRPQPPPSWHEGPTPKNAGDYSPAPSTAYMGVRFDVPRRVRRPVTARELRRVSRLLRETISIDVMNLWCRMRVAAGVGFPRPRGVMYGWGPAWAAIEVLRQPHHQEYMRRHGLLSDVPRDCIVGEA